MNSILLLILSLTLVLLSAAVPARAELFRVDSKDYGPTKMDIVIRETERRPRSSLVEIMVKNPGSSVGSSFFLLCSLRTLGRERGYPRYIAKAEDFPVLRNEAVAHGAETEEYAAAHTADGIFGYDIGRVAKLHSARSSSASRSVSKCTLATLASVMSSSRLLMKTRAPIRLRAIQAPRTAHVNGNDSSDDSNSTGANHGCELRRRRR